MVQGEGGCRVTKKFTQQSIWPVSMFGLGFLLLIMGLSGVANIQETRRIHEQILLVEDNYRQVENLVEGIRSDTSRVAVLRRDRLLDAGAPGPYLSQLAEVRSRTEASLNQLRIVRQQQESSAFEGLASALRSYLDMVASEFRENATAGMKRELVNDRLGAQSMTIFAVSEELRKLNEENFESRRRALTRSVEALQNDIWETILTALFFSVVIAAASIFRINSLEKETAAHQRATEQAEERLRHLSQQLVSSQEQERKFLSRELHDEIGQLLTALRMELGNLERAKNGNGSDWAPHLEQAKKLAETTLRSTRDIAMGLRPAMLDVLGLGPALEWQAREYSRRYHTPIQLEVAGDLKDLPDPHRTYLYRIVQEGLTNCARHAQAKNIKVRLQDENGQMAVTVEDDGVGFDQRDGGVVYGLGLLGMTERVRELCGKIAIKSEPGKGTRIDVLLPREQEGK
jgi:signal transduction histidine kinase